MLQYPQVALDFMNRDHADFVALRDQLLNLPSAQIHNEKVDMLLNELLEHTRRHFAEEERLMHETRFPPYPMHKGEHDSVLAEISAKIDSWKKAREMAALRDWIERRMGDWFVNHVGSMDFVTARFIASQPPTE